MFFSFFLFWRTNKIFRSGKRGYNLLNHGSFFIFPLTNLIPQNQRHAEWGLIIISSQYYLIPSSPFSFILRKQKGKQQHLLSSHIPLPQNIDHVINSFLRFFSNLQRKTILCHFTTAIQIIPMRKFYFEMVYKLPF